MEVSAVVANMVAEKLTDAIQGMFQRNLISMAAPNQSFTNITQSTPKYISTTSQTRNIDEDTPIYAEKRRTESHTGVRNIMDDIQNIDPRSRQTIDPPHDCNIGSESMVT